MNFLVDSQLPPTLAQWISIHGHKAIHVSEVGMLAADDSKIWQYAQEERAVIISKDEDFTDRWLLSDENVSLLWIRKGNCSNRALILWFEPLWPDVLKRLEQGERLVELRA